MTVTPITCVRCEYRRPHHARGMCRDCYSAARQHGELPVAAVQLSDAEREVRIADGWRALLLAIAEDPHERTGRGDRRNLALVNGGKA